MPDEEGNVEGEPTESPLHAYEEGREEQVEGDPTGQPDKLEGDPDAEQAEG